MDHDGCVGTISSFDLLIIVAFGRLCVCRVLEKEDTNLWQAGAASYPRGQQASTINPFTRSLERLTRRKEEYGPLNMFYPLNIALYSKRVPETLNLTPIRTTKRRTATEITCSSLYVSYWTTN